MKGAIKTIIAACMDVIVRRPIAEEAGFSVSGKVGIDMPAEFDGLLAERTLSDAPDLRKREDLSRCELRFPDVEYCRCAGIADALIGFLPKMTRSLGTRRVSTSQDRSARSPPFVKEAVKRFEAGKIG